MTAVPLQVTFRNMDPSDAIESTIRDKVDKLSQFGPLDRCRIMVECPHNHHAHGSRYHVRIDMSVPGSELVVAHQGSGDHSHEDLHVAIRDAFRAARRELQTYGDKRRGHVKHHSA